MPYIKKELRTVFDAEIERLSKAAATPGELNYIITQLLRGTEPKSYADFNALVGVLECAKLELYRRALAIYENEAILRNGDVYE